jgi:hypothetical protein
MKDKIIEFESGSRTKKIRHLYRDIDEFKEGYRPSINLVKDENCRFPQ